MAKLGTRIVVGIPTVRYARRSGSWVEAMAGIQFPLGSSMGRFWIEDERIDVARNQLAEKALEMGADYLFFLSDDVLAPPNALLSMLEKIGREFPDERGRPVRADMVTGVYWTKTYPQEPYLWRGMLRGGYTDWKAGEFFPVDLAGCDCLLISTEVLRNVPRPWFSTDWVWQAEQRKPDPIATEDFYFFLKARRAGYRLFCDSSVQCLHEDRQSGVMFGLQMDMRQAGGVPLTSDDEEILVAELGAGAACPAYGKRTKVVRFDIRAEVKPDYRVDIAHIPEQFFGQFDLVHVSHVIEHFQRKEAPSLIRHWVQLLKPGGRLVVRVPDVAIAMRRILDRTAENYDWSMIYGDQGDEGAPWEHKNGFTERKLEMLLRTHPCLGEIRVEHEKAPEVAHNLVATARLVREDRPQALADWWEEIERQESPARGEPGSPTEEVGDGTVDTRPVQAGPA